MLALAQLLNASELGQIEVQLRGTKPTASTGARKSSSPARSVICLFQHGGPSQVDLFDPKPEMLKWNGKPYPLGELEIHALKESGNVLASPFRFRHHGESGIELSELLPHLGTMIDDVTLIRSMTTESVDHEAALRRFHTGRKDSGYPTWGSWVTYGLGTECENLPAYVVLADAGGLPLDGNRNWSSGWLPARHQGTPFLTGSGSPVVDLQTPANVPPGARKEQLAFLDQLNQFHLRQHPENSELSARIQNFELAAQMQASVPAFLDISGETLATQKMYGLDREETREYGTRCLLARRLVEQGVRFVQVFMSGQPWDTHKDNAAELTRLCDMTDQPTVALLRDLKQRGLLDSTIVLWGGEFGRLPIAQGLDGRDHNRHGFSIWAAGGGFRAGYVHGETDDFGYRAITDPVSTHDLHATLLHTLGLNHVRLTYPHSGRETSLTDPEVTQARVISELLKTGV